MSNQYIWIISIKSKVLGGCRITWDDAKFLFVEYLSLANGLEEAIAETKAQLSSLKLELMNIRWCMRYRQSEWANDPTDIGTDIILTVEKIRRTREPRFTTFRSPGVEVRDNDDQLGDLL